LKRPSDEEILINEAKERWNKLRKQKKMIRMMSFFGTEKIKEMKKTRDNKFNKDIAV
jgi:hypothetical protein